MPFSLRRAALEDIGRIAEIHVRARRDCLPFLPDIHPLEDVASWLREEVFPQQELWVAESAGEIFGYAALGADMLNHLYVAPDRQGEGIGGALLDRAKELRPNGFRLWVFQRNAQARRFYERRGLRLVDLTDGSGNEECEPDALYEWRTSPEPGAPSKTTAAP